MSEPGHQAAAGCSSYKVDIRPKFTKEDIDHMNNMVGLDLSDYATVRDNADAILRRLQETDPGRLMPPPPREPPSISERGISIRQSAGRGTILCGRAEDRNTGLP